MSAAQELRQAYERLLRERGLVADARQREVLEHLARLADLLAAGTPVSPLRRALARRFPRAFALRSPRGIYLWGAVGRGKSWLMDLFFNYASTPQRLRSHFHHFMHDVHVALAAIKGRARPLEAVARQIAASTQLICLDELFVADIGDAMILHGLFAALLREGVTLVITSNQPPGELYHGGLQRERFLPAIRLLETQLDVIELGGREDYRLRTLARANTYVLDGAPEAARQLRELFDRLANEAPGDPAGARAPRTLGTLRVQGRPIPVLRAVSGMAWFDFSALCEGPRSQEDYIELACELHTLFVTGVPVLDELKDDAARRFIALVDELYDNNVKLVVGAAAEPSSLYSGERLRQAFARTVSRLIEMRSQEYLAREHRARMRL